MKTSRFLPPFIAVFAVTAVLSAKDEDPARAEAGRLMQQAAQAKAEGRYDEARELAEKAKRIEGDSRERDRKKGDWEGADRRDERFANMKREIEELRREGKYEEAEHRIRELREGWAREHGSDGAKREGEMPDNIKHIMEAVRHLRAAGVTEPADHLEQEATRMKAEFEQHRREEEQRRRAEGERRDGDKGRGAGESPEVRELREQVQKMSREMERLRNELNKQRGEGAQSE